MSQTPDRWSATVAKSHPDDTADQWWNVVVKYPDGGHQILWCRTEREACRLASQINIDTSDLAEAVKWWDEGGVNWKTIVTRARDLVAQ